MKTLLALSLLINTLFLVYFFRRIWRSFSIEIIRTYWSKKPYGIIVLIWPNDNGFDNGQILFSIYWRKPDEFANPAKK